MNMAEQGELDQEDVAVVDEQQPEDETNAVPEAEAPEATEESDEITVSIGEESPPPEESAAAPEWVRELRKSHREAQRKIREYEQKLQTLQATETKPVALGAKPKLEDYDYDSDKFEQALDAWHERKRQVADVEARAKAAQEEQAKAWQTKLESYGKAKAELKVRDYDDAEEIAQQTLSVVQQGVILQGADNPALVVYALGKNPKKAKELSSIADPVKFAFAVAKLEKELKVMPRKSAPAPERVVQTTGPKSGAVDSTLERLRAEAEKTGDYNKVMQYKRQKRST
jgi:phage shock protein A